MQSLKLLAALFVCTLFIFGFSQVGVLVTNQWLPHTNSFSEATLIANEEVSNTSKPEAVERLEAAKNTWLTNGTIYLEWTGELQPFPKDAFSIFVPESIEYAVDGSQNKLQVELPDGIMLEQIELLSQSTDIFSALNTEELKQDLEEAASELKEGDHTFSLADYLIDENVMEQTSNQVSLSLTGVSVRSELMDVLNNKEITLLGNETFSIHTWLAKENITLSDEAASIVATLLNQLIAPTNFPIAERHISKELPAWAPIGYEALIQKGKMDYVFTNPNHGDYKITFAVDAMSVTGDLTGGPLPYTYTVTQEEKKMFSPKTVVQYSSTLMGNQKKIVETGKEGFAVHLVRTAIDPSGNVMETVVYSEDFYAPIQRIEQHSLTQPVVAANPDNNTGTNPPAVTSPNGTNTTGPNTNTNTNTNNNTGTTTNPTNPGTSTGTAGSNTNNNTTPGNTTGNQNNTGGSNSTSPGSGTGTGNSNGGNEDEKDPTPGIPGK